MKFQNKYNRNSLRLRDYDYSDGIFFITICTKNKTNFFGNITEGEMNLSEEGKVLDMIWQMAPSIFDYAEIGEFVVMPNHFHAILSISKTRKNKKNIPPNNLLGKGGFAGEKNPMLSNNMSTVIRWFKGKCTYGIRKFNKDFSWQDRFYDNIIRDAVSFQNIENYIINNPKNWDTDSLK